MCRRCWSISNSCARHVHQVSFLFGGYEFVFEKAGKILRHSVALEWLVLHRMCVLCWIGWCMNNAIVWWRLWYSRHCWGRCRPSYVQSSRSATITGTRRVSNGLSGLHQTYTSWHIEAEIKKKFTDKIFTFICWNEKCCTVIHWQII